VVIKFLKQKGVVMIQDQRNFSGEALVIAGLVFMNAIILNEASTESREYLKSLFVSVPMLWSAVSACFAK
jgi:hypothetical protein